MLKKILTLASCIFLFLSASSQDFERISCKEMESNAFKVNYRASGVGKEYDLKYHRLEWHIDPNIRQISGTVTSYFVVTQNNLSQIRFDFHNSLVVDFITYHGTNLTYTEAANVLTIDLPAPLSLSAFDSLSITYHGIPPQTGFGSFVKQTHSGTPIIWTLSEPYGGKDWWPNKEDLSDKIDSIDVIVTTPSQYRVASNG